MSDPRTRATNVEADYETHVEREVADYDDAPGEFEQLTEENTDYGD